MRVSAALLTVGGLFVSETMGMFLGEQIFQRAPAVLEALAGATPVAQSTTTSSTSTTSVAPTTTPTTTTAAAATTTPTVATSTPVVAAAAAAATGAGSAASISTSQLYAAGFVALGQNANSNNGQCWIGSDGANTNVVTNGSGESIIVVVWGPSGSWMTGSTPPLITHALGPGQSVTISCGNISGGMAAIYQDQISSGALTAYGQVANTWFEFTYGPWGTYDISREITMSGRPISAVGPTCTANMSTCVFVCNSGNTCYQAGTYALQNCNAANGGGSDAAAMNGGCTSGSNLHLQTTFS